jgi:hypothetical protein
MTSHVIPALCKGPGRDSVAREAPKGWKLGRRQWTHQEGSSGIRDRDLKGQLLPGSKRAFNKTVRKTELLPALTERRMKVVNLDQLAPYEGNTRDKRPLGGTSGSSWIVISVRTKPRGRKVRPITDITSTAVRKEEMVVCL